MTESDRNDTKKDSIPTPTSPEPKKSKFAAYADRIIGESGGDLSVRVKPGRKPKPKPKLRPGPKPKPKPPPPPKPEPIAEVKADIIKKAGGSKQEPTLTMEGLEDAAESLTEDSKKILDFLLTDIINDDTGRDPNVTRSIRRACRRAQMREKKADEITFFRHVTDPGFMKTVKDTGAALVGAHILPLVATLLNIAIEERKQWAMTACLKISGLLPTQYDIYQLKYENTHTNIFSGEVNYGDKTDKELKDICAQIYDVEEADEAGG